MLESNDIRRLAAGLKDRLVEVRRRIHESPELGLETPQTQRLIVEELERIGIKPIRQGAGCTSVVVDIVGTAGDSSKARVALRADMDALPVTERTGFEFASRNQGCMHACGHDAHVAMLLGAAELLHANRAQFAGCVRLLFQPGEEGYGGAKVMIDEGALEGVDSAFAIHVDPSRPAHVVSFRPGTMLAAFDNFEIVFRGRGGHASTPHATLDPIPAIGPLVDGLSHVSARETDPNDRVVYSVTQVIAGTADNVIPAEATCIGTIRSVSREGRRLARERVERVAEGVARSRGLEVEVRLEEGYPPTLNDAQILDSVAATAADLKLRTNDMAAPFMGAEDFSYVLERVPGAFVFLGCGVAGSGPLHSDVMRVDEDVLPTGAALHVATALRLLARDSS